MDVKVAEDTTKNQQEEAEKKAVDQTPQASAPEAPSDQSGSEDQTPAPEQEAALSHLNPNSNCPDCIDGLRGDPKGLHAVCETCKGTGVVTP